MELTKEGRGAKKMEAKDLVLSKEEKDLIGKEVKNWCSCNLGQEAYGFHVPPNKECAICARVRRDDGKMDNDHYHCGACMKLSQIG